MTTDDSSSSPCCELEGVVAVDLSESAADAAKQFLSECKSPAASKIEAGACVQDRYIYIYMRCIYLCNMYIYCMYSIYIYTHCIC